MKSFVPNDHSTALKKFHGGAVVTFMLLHVLTGLVVSCIPFDEFQWMNDFFIRIDTALPAFRTWFVNSKNPISCKVMLLLWWVVFVPWGLILAGRLIKGINALNHQKVPKPLARIIGSIFGLLFAIFIARENSLVDHSAELIPYVPGSGRPLLGPILMRFGPFGVSIHLVLSTVGFLGGICLFLITVRAIFSNGSIKDKS